MTNPYENDLDVTQAHTSDPTEQHMQAVPGSQPSQPQGGHVTKAPRRRNRRGCLVIGFVGMLMSVLLCVASFALYVVFPPAPIDVLILGVDVRPDQAQANITRTDSIMLAGIDPADMRVSLLSIPRDAFIQVPNYGMQRINAVNVLGEMEQEGRGRELLMESIAQNFQIQPDKYVMLNFQAFTALVDAVGGVDIEVEKVIVDYAYPTEDYGTRELRFDPGLQHMDGETALAYARTRHADNDYYRAGRQQQVVEALARKLLNPIYWPGAYAAVTANVQTNLSPVDLLQMLPPVIASGGNFEQLVINQDYLLSTGDGGATPYYDKIREWTEGRFD